MTTWTWSSKQSTIAWADDFGDFHICCTVVQERSNLFTAVVEENGAELFRASIVVPSLQYSLPWALELREKFRDRVDHAFEAELDRLKKLRPGFEGEDFGA